MNLLLIALISGARLAPAAAEARVVTAVEPAALVHPGDARAYFIYPGAPVAVEAEAPATLEIAVRGLLRKGKTQTRLHLTLWAGKEQVLDQSQVLGVDPRARRSGRKVSRPLVGIADVPARTGRVRVEVRVEDRGASAVLVAVGLVDDSEPEAPADSAAPETLLPSLVTPASDEGAVAGGEDTSSDDATSIGVGDGAAREVDASADADLGPSRYAAVELAAVFGLGVPGVELGGRYFLPFFGERLSLGGHVGYGFYRGGGSAGPLASATRVEATLHLVPIFALMEIEALRFDTPAGRLFLGARAEGGVAPFFGALNERTLLPGGEEHLVETPLLGWVWCAGGEAVVGLETDLGVVAAEAGYLYAPEAEASADRDARRGLRQRVLGARLALAYRLVF